MRLPITGAGLVTALGYGAAGTCAALRAGLTLPRELVRSAPTEDEDDGPDIAAFGYPAHDFAEGFFQTGAWVRLASGAAEDLIHRADLAEAGAGLWQRTLLVGAVPRITRERFLWDLDTAPEAPREGFLEPLAELVPGLSAEGARWNAAGHVSLAAALLQVEQALLARSADRCLVAGADSFVDEWSLAALAAAQRLKDPAHPTGLMPGEAGAALLLESETAVRRRHAPILGYVDAVAVAEPPASTPREREEDVEDDLGWLPPAAPALGRSIAEAVRQVLPKERARWKGDLFLDQNGEHWRAEAWGHACVHLASLMDLDDARTLLAAESLGELGAAAAPVALTWALWNFHREQTQSAIVISVSDEGAVGAVRLSPPELP